MEIAEEVYIDGWGYEVYVAQAEFEYLHTWDTTSIDRTRPWLSTRCASDAMELVM